MSRLKSAPEAFAASTDADASRQRSANVVVLNSTPSAASTVPGTTAGIHFSGAVFCAISHGPEAVSVSRLGRLPAPAIEHSASAAVHAAPSHLPVTSLSFLSFYQSTCSYCQRTHPLPDRRSAPRDGCQRVHGQRREQGVRPSTCSRPRRRRERKGRETSRSTPIPPAEPATDQ